MVVLTEDIDIESLKEQTMHGDRLDEASSKEEQQDFVEDINDQLDAIEAGDEQKTLSVWDGHLTAFVRALEANPEHMNEVGQGLQRRLDMEGEEIDRSEILRLALRLGFREAAPDQYDAIREAAQKRAAKRF